MVSIAILMLLAGLGWVAYMGYNAFQDSKDEIMRNRKARK